jgi:hypothetical protein
MALGSSIPMPQFVVTARDDELQRSIIAKTVALGTNLADEFKQQMLLLVRDVLAITPPAGGKLQGAQQAGQAAIDRDLFLMGFVPVEIKGHRTITMAFGHKIAPVTVKTKINPKFADPDAFHRARLVASKKQGRRGKASRGGAQAFYVSKSKYASMRSRLFKQIGTLAAPWLPGIRAMNNGALPAWVPAWIKRHEADAAGRAHYQVNFDPQQGKLFIHLVNSMPETANDEAAATQRRIEAAKGYRINAIRRGLEGRAKRIARERR